MTQGASKQPVDAARRLSLAIEFIEQQLDQGLTIEQIAASAHVSAYHFARWFRARTGRSVMGYVRARRLARSVPMLRSDPRFPPLIDVALAVGFDTPQGFINAFRKAFGVAPGAYRRVGHPLHLQEKINVTNPDQHQPEGPEYHDRGAFVIAGMSTDVRDDDKSSIPPLWQRFAPMIGHVATQRSDVTYGACVAGDSGSFTYMAAVEVDRGVSSAALGPALVTREIPAARYAVFTHRGSLDYIHETMTYIFGEWLPESGHTLCGVDFERYAEDFAPDANEPDIEVWLPVQLL